MTKSTTIVRAGIIAILVCSGIAVPAAFAQPQGAAVLDEKDPGRLAPTASHGGTARLLPPQAISENADPLNQAVAAATVDGLVLTVTIDGKKVILDAATPARIPRRMAVADRATGGDTVKATAFAGGKALGTTVIPDTVLNASEEEGLVRTVRRQLSIALAADRPIEKVVIEAPATEARAEIDVRSAYDAICKADRRDKWCPQR